MADLTDPMQDLTDFLQSVADVNTPLADIAQPGQQPVWPFKKLEYSRVWYDSQVRYIRDFNQSCQYYQRMPPMPGKPLLPDELYPVDYEDLSTLTEERADTLMTCFGIDSLYENPNIKNKIFEIACFIGVRMKKEFMDEYEDWERKQDWEKTYAAIRSRNRNDSSKTLE